MPQDLPTYLEPPRGSRGSTRGGFVPQHDAPAPPAAMAPDPASYELVVAGQSGVVAWFDRGKRFGFITQDSGQKDLFVHQEQVEAAGLPYLLKDQSVSYDVARSGKGSGKIVRPANPAPRPGRRRRSGMRLTSVGVGRWRSTFA